MDDSEKLRHFDNMGAKQGPSTPRNPLEVQCTIIYYDVLQYIIVD